METSYKSKIYNNPYRILGVYANASIKDIKANEAKAKAFLNVGKEVSYSCDFCSALSPLSRTSEMMAMANSQLTLPNEKIKHALFWFVKATPLDDIAFNHLDSGNAQQAISIWKKKECFSSLLNISTLALAEGYVLMAVDSMMKLLETESYRSNLITAVTDETFCISEEELVHTYLNEFIPDSAYSLLENSTLSDEYKEYVRNELIAPLISNIEVEINKAKSIKNENFTGRYNAGVKLMNQANDLLAGLKKLLPTTDMRFQIIADKLGLEILQCGIDYYNNSDDADSAHKAMKLQSYAQSIVVGQMAKDRCKQNTDILKKIIDELPPFEVLEEDKQIKKELALFLLRPNNIGSANDLMKSCAPYIIRIKEKIGTTHKYYLNISTQIVQGALHNVIEEVNQAIEDWNKNKRWGISSILNDAWNATLNMEQFDMDLSFKSNRFLPQKKALEKILYSVDSSIISHVLLHPMFDTKAEIDLRTDKERFNACSTIESYKKYLEDFPNGRFVSQTQDKLIKLQRIEDERRRKETDLFKSCSSKKEYEVYISKYPYGKYVNEAHKKIDEINSRNKLYWGLAILAIVIAVFIYWFQDRDLRAFEKIKKRTTIEKCQTFIERYPNSIKVAEAKKMIEKQYENELIKCKDSASLTNFINKYSSESRYIQSRYKKEYKQKYIDMAKASLKAETERLNKEREERHKQEMKEWSTESRAWIKASQGGTLELYEKYLKMYPYGAHSTQAKQKIIDLEVSNVFASGNYGQLPSMDRTGYSNSAYSTVSVRNDTQYTLTLLYSGAESKRLVISSHSSKSVRLKSGSYRIVASVDAYNVRNFAGREELSGGSYDVSYYITTSRF